MKDTEIKSFPPFTFDLRIGELVTREEIQRTLWEEETFVDFDLGINSCVRQIRTALGNDADHRSSSGTPPPDGTSGWWETKVRVDRSLCSRWSSMRMRAGMRNFDVTPDGQRFVMLQRDAPATTNEVHIVLNWFQELKRLVPTGN